MLSVVIHHKKRMDFRFVMI